MVSYAASDAGGAGHESGALVAMVGLSFEAGMFGAMSSVCSTACEDLTMSPGPLMCEECLSPDCSRVTLGAGFKSVSLASLMPMFV